MIEIKLTRNKAHIWHFEADVYAKGYLFDSEQILYQGVELCKYFSQIADEFDFSKRLLSANGLFSVVIKQEKFTGFAVDRLRHFPLFYRMHRENLVIGDEIENLSAIDESNILDEEAVLSFSGISYVLGQKTLLKNVFQVQAGEYIQVRDNQLSNRYYHQLHSSIRDIRFDEAQIELKQFFDRVIQRLRQLIGTRPVVLLLSGGLDSRLVAYLLKKAGIKKVLCVTFGVKTDNPEWQRSEQTAKQLGYEWQFIDYTNKPISAYYNQVLFEQFYQYEAQYTAKFGFMTYFLMDELVNQQKIPANTFFLNGDGGDFFAGSHLRPYMRYYRNVKTIAKDLQYIHCDIVSLNQKEKNKITQLIMFQLNKNIWPLFENVENWELKERQSKYVFNTRKINEFYGFQTLFPLCDNELMDFYTSLPFEYRLNKKLYLSVITDFFREFQINFPQDSVKTENSFLQRLKIYLKRQFPFLKRDVDLYKYDYFDFKRLFLPMLNDLDKTDHKRKIRLSNAIVSEWYLRCVIRKIQKPHETTH